VSSEAARSVEDQIVCPACVPIARKQAEDRRTAARARRASQPSAFTPKDKKLAIFIGIGVLGMVVMVVFVAVAMKGYRRRSRTSGRPYQPPPRPPVPAPPPPPPKVRVRSPGEQVEITGTEGREVATCKMGNHISAKWAPWKRLQTYPVVSRTGETQTLKPSGVFVVVDVEVENTGTTARTFYFTTMCLYWEGATYRPVSVVGVKKPIAGVVTIQPRLSVRAHVVFDVPKEVTSARVGFSTDTRSATLFW